MHGHSHSHHAHHLLNKRAILVPIIASLFLVVLKIWGWQQTGSVSLLSSLLDSAIDILVSSLNLAAIIYAAQPADDDHRFGHTAIEDIVGLVQASFIAATAFFLIYESAVRAIDPQPITHANTGVVVMLISMAFPLAIVVYQQIILRKTKSIVLEADSLHYLSDVLMNGLIIVSIVIAALEGWAWVDPLFGFIIALYILYTSAKIGMRAFNHLMDKAAPAETLEKIRHIIAQQKGIKGHHALKTRISGSKLFIQLHADIDATLTLLQAHEIADALEDSLKQAFDSSEVIVHMDPK